MKEAKTLREEMMDYLQKNQEMTSNLIDSILMIEEVEARIDEHFPNKEDFTKARIESKNKKIAQLEKQINKQNEIIELQARLIEELKQQKETLA